MGWSYKPLPCRLLHHEDVICLNPHDRAVLGWLYCGADEHGRFRNHPDVLRVLLGMIGLDWDPHGAIQRLAQSGLVHLYEHKGKQYGVLDQFDQDITSEQLKKRTRSVHPSPPELVWIAAGVDGSWRKGKHSPADEPTETVLPVSRQRPDAAPTAARRGPPKQGSTKGKQAPRKVRVESRASPVGLVGPSGRVDLTPEQEQARRETIRRQCNE